MTKRQAMKILCSSMGVVGKIDDTKIILTKTDIESNLKNNDYKLNLDWIQDFEAVVDGNYEMFQGHSLSEIEVSI